jgi:spore germination cell wall hydrolase CwlJ-like protein
VCAALAVLAACATIRPDDPGERAKWLALESRGLSEASLRRILADMDPAARALALRFDPARHTGFWGRPAGWQVYDIGRLPTLGFGLDALTFDEARRINGYLPAAKAGVPARPFVLRASSDDAQRAQHCLAQAVYYEAASESDQGQAAVAQTVLNRVRDPGFPKSVCGVVFQGSGLPTGCQFSFTCDGSLARQPSADGWARAMAVARRALNGFVEKSVGYATHYHADYVRPYWAPTLVKLNQIGAHIFYRWSGPGGDPSAFTGRYAGGEAHVSTDVLKSLDPRIQLAEAVATQTPRTVTLGVAGEVRTYVVADAAAPGGVRARVSGEIAPSRPAPTSDQVDQVNAALGGEGAKAVPDMPVTEVNKK